MAAFVYEGVLLFGVSMTAAYLYGALTQQRHALQGRHGLQAFLFLVLGIYFVWFWARSGQTVAMKAWHIRLVRRDGTPVTQRRAALRYLLSWAWLAPALASIAILDVRRPRDIAGWLLGGIVVYAALSRLHPRRQFIHDALCDTELVNWRAPLERQRTGATGS